MYSLINRWGVLYDFYVKVVNVNVFYISTSVLTHFQSVSAMNMLTPVYITKHLNTEYVLIVEIIQ